MTEIEDWVREQLNAGYSKEQIKQSLIENGWDSSTIDEVLYPQQMVKTEIIPENSNENPLPESQNSEKTPSPDDFNKMSYFQKVKMILFHPKKFFDEMPVSGGYGEPVKFIIFTYIIYSIIETLGTIVLAILSGGNFIEPLTMILAAGFISILYIITSVIVYAIIGPIILFIIAGVYHVLLRLFGAKGDYEATFRVYAYVSSLALISIVLLIPTTTLPTLFDVSLMTFMIISFLIGLCVGIYGLYVSLVGLSKVHDIPKKRVLFAMLIPIVIVLLLSISLGFGAIFMNQMMQSSQDVMLSDSEAVTSTEEICAIAVFNQPGAASYLSDVIVHKDGMVDATVKNAAGEEITIGTTKIQSGAEKTITNIGRISSGTIGTCYLDEELKVELVYASGLDFTIPIKICGAYQE